jgi:hypothetical protein
MDNFQDDFSHEVQEKTGEVKEITFSGLIKRYRIWFIILSVGYTIYGVTQGYSFFVSLITGIALGIFFVLLMMMNAYLRSKMRRKK